MLNYIKKDRTLLLSGLLGLVVIMLVFMKACDKKKLDEIMNPDLTKDEKSAVIVDGAGNVTKIDRDGNKTVTDTTHGVRDVRVSIGKDNKLKVTLRSKGFIFEPGIGVVETSSPRVVLDVQYYFFHQWGVNGGLSFSSGHNDKLRLYLGGSYTLPWKMFSNTSVLVTYDTKKEIGAGIRIKF